MEDEIKQIKKIVNKLMINFGVKDFNVSAMNRLENDKFKILVKYKTKENCENVSLILLNLKTGLVEKFVQNIPFGY